MSEHEFIEQYFQHIENGKRILEICDTLMTESISNETQDELVDVSMDSLRGIARELKYQEGECFKLTINGIEVSMIVRERKDE